MAEAVVGFVLSKLIGQATYEASKLYAVNEQVTKTREALEYILVLIRGADTMQIRDVRLRVWLQEVRELAYRAEDAFDILQVELYHRQVSIWERMFPYRQKHKLVKFQREMNTIAAAIQLLLEQQEIIDEIRNLPRISEGGSVQQLARQPVLSDIQTAPVLEKDEERVLNLLFDQSIPRRVILPIAGSDEIGKTALAEKILKRNTVEQYFDHRLSVRVSQYSLIEIWIAIVQQLRKKAIEPAEHRKKEEYFLTEIHSALSRDKRYLIIFNDVLSIDKCIEIIEKLPDEKNGSRVIITTKFGFQWRLPTSKLYPIKSLTEEEALKFLLTTVVPADNMHSKHRDDLTPIARELVIKSGGFPLELTILCWLLSAKPLTVAAWSEVLNKLTGDTAYSDSLFNLAYEDLPGGAQLCFMYFGRFPNNYKVDCRSLIRMWISEGFIVDDENRTLEDTAESYLAELVRRRLVHISQKSHGGTLQCYMNDILQAFAAKKDPKNIYFNSVLCFETLPRIHNPVLFKGLTRNTDGTIDISSFEKFDQIRYLELHWGWDIMKQGYFEKLISGMKFIQTLNLMASQHGDLPDCLWQIQTLVHIILSGYTAGPPSVADLENLRTLIGVTNRESWKARLPNLPNLRDLDIQLYEGFHGAILATFIGKLPYLNSLKIVGDEIPLKTANLRGCRFADNESLQILHLRVYRSLSNNRSFDASMFPVNLIELKLENSRLQQDPMPVLGRLGRLKKLQLRYRALETTKMSCSADLFTVLEELECFVLDKLEEWEISVDAMPKLEKLTISCCPNLRVPRGLKNLIKLRELSWLLHRESGKEKEIHTICQHVQSISVKKHDE